MSFVPLHAEQHPPALTRGRGARRKKVVLTREDDITFTQTALDKMKAWAESGEGKEMEIAPSCNGFLRRFLHQVRPYAPATPTPVPA